MRQGLYTVLITTSSYHFSQKKEGVSNTVVSKLLGEKMLVVQSLQNNTNHTIVSYLKKEKRKKRHRRIIGHVLPQCKPDGVHDMEYNHWSISVTGLFLLSPQ